MQITQEQLSTPHILYISPATYNGFARLKRLCKKPSLGMCYMWKTLAGLAVLLGSCFRRNDKYWVSCTVPYETVQKTSLGYAGGKPNPLNPPYQGDFPLNSPLIRGARGVKNDERWVSCTVSFAGTTSIGFLAQSLKPHVRQLYPQGTICKGLL